MFSFSFGAMSVMLMTVLALAIPVALVWLVVKVLQGAGYLVRGVFWVLGRSAGHLARFVRGEIVDTLHAIGGVITGAVITPLALANLCIGRFSAAGYYGRALEDELTSTALCLYRIGIGHPVRLLGLGALTEGLERRLPELVSRAPRSVGDPRKEKFEGYELLGTLAAGGSGARLFLARPSESKLREFHKRGHADPGQVVIKSFALEHGSTLPQIVRENRALEAAGRMGLVLEHELGDKNFHYVMPFVPGDDLDTVTRRLHARSGSGGLGERELGRVLGYGSDLMETLERFHQGGLWHKDIKPSNLIVSGDRVHVVDLGLVTPLASAMTLTTHGTEYFRDPELVRMAMRGVKVHEVDGVKFDVYSAGAVLYSMVENSFPAHGSLSRIAKPCPESLQWIIRRAMADMSTRYGSAREMWGDLQKLLAADDPWLVLPAELPSVTGSDFSSPDFSRPPSVELAGGPAPDGAVPETDLRARRKVRRRVLGAAGIVGMTGLMLGGVVMFARDGRGRSYQIEWLPGAMTGSQARAGARVPAEIGTQPDVPVGSAGRVLILTDVNLPSSTTEDDVWGRHLYSRGWDVLGLGSGDVELIAQAQHALGMADPGSQEARIRMQEFLADHQDLDAVVWFYPGLSDGETLKKLILRGPPAHSSRWPESTSAQNYAGN